MLALIVSNAYWLYKTIDNGIALDYAADSANFTSRSLQQAIRVANLNVIGMSADEVLERLNPTVYGLAPFEKEGCIHAAQICLQLDETRTVVVVR